MSRKGWWVLRTRGLSMLLCRRSLGWLLVLAGCLVVVGVLALWQGPVQLSAAELWQALLRQGNPLWQFIVQQLRLPRVELGIMVGGSLALAGYLLQQVTRIPIAAPSVLGLTDGAGLMVVLCLFFGKQWTARLLVSPYGLAIAALVGVILILLILMFLRWRTPDLEKIIFSGLILAAICKAASSLVLVVSTTDTATLSQQWLMGSLTLASLPLNHALWPVFALLIVMTLVHARTLTVSPLERSLQQNLGVVRGTEWRLYLLASGFIALAVAGAGQIGFVGLVVPHVARWLCPRSVVAQLLGCLFGGAALVLGADMISRWLFAPYELPVGIMTAGIGVPFFAVLYWRRSLAQ
jgi:iron complex transport system permease protein